MALVKGSDGRYTYSPMPCPVGAATATAPAPAPPPLAAVASGGGGGSCGSSLRGSDVAAALQAVAPSRPEPGGEPPNPFLPSKLLERPRPVSASCSSAALDLDSCDLSHKARWHSRSLVNADVQSEKRVRGKLEETGSSFHDLDRQVEEDARRRKELHEQNMRELVYSLTKLQRTLSIEAERREDASRKVSSAIDELLGDMVTSLQQKFSERFRHLSSCLAGLSDRCALLERGIQQFKGAVPTKLVVEMEVLKQNLKDLSTDLHLDHRQREASEEHLRGRIQAVQDHAEQQCLWELSMLAKQADALQENIDSFASGEGDAEASKGRAEVASAVHALFNGLTSEEKLREQADDRVVEAINEYASTLQRSLQLANA